MNDILLTAAEVAKRKDRKAELEREIQAAQQELAVVNRWLDAVAILTAGSRPSTEATGSRLPAFRPNGTTRHEYDGGGGAPGPFGTGADCQG